MEIPTPHAWDLRPTEAVALQRALAHRVSQESVLPTPCRYIAGVDGSYARFSDQLFAGVVVWDAQAAAIVETAGYTGQMVFPYIPGLLSFREALGILAALRQLQITPDAVLVDGVGYAHPRRFGIACHLGVLLDLPTIGCAKSRLVGRYEEPGQERGDRSPLVQGEEVIGTVLRTRDRVKPLFISIGHKVSLDAAADLTLACCRGYRLPEPTRLAHQHVNHLRTTASKGGHPSDRRSSPPP